MNEYISNPDEAKEYWNRYKIFYIAISLTFLIVLSRLWYLQIMTGTELRQFSEKNRIKQSKILAPRGLMLDREGRVLVENLPGFEALASPQYITDLDALAKSLSPILGVEPDKLVARIQRSKKQNGPFAPVRLKENLSRDEVFRLKRIRLEIPSLEIRENILRSYPLKTNGAQLFGYVGEISKRQIPRLNELYSGQWKFEQGDIIGKAGLEESLESDIRGVDGISFTQVDAHGRETASQTPNVYGEQIKDKDPIHGHNAVLTIDRDIQEAANQAMLKLDRIGGLVAMKSNGEILAWMNNPSFDPNEFAAGPPSSQVWSKLINDPFKPFRNKVIQDFTAPGSTFKPFVALAALQEKVISPTTIVPSPGVFRFGGRPYHDHLRGGHGNITVFEALEKSSNVFFYKMGVALGIDKMYNYIHPLGIGRKTGVEVGREAAGRMPSAEWKKRAIGEEWQPGENLSAAIGQGFVEATPLQMAVAYNAIGTEGKVVKPFVVRKIVDQDGRIVREEHPKVERDLTQIQDTGVRIDPATFKVVKEAMRRVANGTSGTARFWKVPGVQIAGKTGTAQVMGFSADQIYVKCESRPVHLRHHGWFIGWAPWDKPEITVAVLAEHSCHGNTGAAPIVRDIVLAYFQKYHPEIIAEATKKKPIAPSALKPIEPVETSEGE
ncbi:MAG: penicillin-binding protein 2 [Bdellovibrionaceae bacterium]|nr:penicillin-binding protein 2 [Pseudobdellovibrionaceae bacterium]